MSDFIDVNDLEVGEYYVIKEKESSLLDFEDYEPEWQIARYNETFDHGDFSTCGSEELHDPKNYKIKRKIDIDKVKSFENTSNKKELEEGQEENQF